MALRHGIAEEHGRALPAATEHHQFDPELQDVDARAEDSAEVEELRSPVRAVIVMDRHFNDAEAGVLHLAHQLQADHAAVAIELHAIEDLAPHQAEVAVHVAHAQREEHLHREVIHAADDDAMQRIRSADLVSGHHVRIVAKPFPERGDLGGVVLGVAVGVRDELLGRGREA